MFAVDWRRDVCPGEVSMVLPENDMEWPSMDAVSSLLLAKHVSFYLSLSVNGV